MIVLLSQALPNFSHWEWRSHSEPKSVAYTHPSKNRGIPSIASKVQNKKASTISPRYLLAESSSSMNL